MCRRHPFGHGRRLFMHNGFIDGFAAVKRDLVLAVDESLLNPPNPAVRDTPCRHREHGRRFVHTDDLAV